MQGTLEHIQEQSDQLRKLRGDIWGACEALGAGVHGGHQEILRGAASALRGMHPLIVRAAELVDPEMPRELLEQAANDLDYLSKGGMLELGRKHRLQRLLYETRELTAALSVPVPA